MIGQVQTSYQPCFLNPHCKLQNLVYPPAFMTCTLLACAENQPKKTRSVTYGADLELG